MQNAKNEQESDKELANQGMSSTQCSESCQERLQDIKEIYNEQLSPTAVYLAYDADYKKQIIIKKIFKNKLSSYQLEQARLECQISCNISHFNLCKGFASYENNEEIGIFMEFVNDADYFVEKIENNHQVIKNELKLKSYTMDIIKGLQKLHQEGYVHLDIKLSNLYCDQKQQNDIRRVKVADFGLCHKIDQEKGFAFVKHNCGTLGYKAPEVKDNSMVTTSADMWSLGIVLYMMVCAYKPDQIKGYKYGSGPIPFRAFDWKNKSPLLKQFVEKLLKFDWKERINCDQALEDPWFQE